MREVTEALLALLEAGEAGALATVVKTSGSTPQAPGARLLLLAGDRRVGTVGGGALERLVIDALQDVKQKAVSRLLSCDLGRDLGMCCGGSMEIFVEPIVATPRLWIFGAGHVAQPTAALARSVGFEVVVVDERDELNVEERFPGCRREPIDPASALGREQIGGRDWLLIVTHDHHLDEEALRAALAHEPRYIGVVGSRRKIFRLLERVAARKGPLDLDRVYAPVGLNLGAISPHEIAVSIVAELIAVRHGAKSTGHLRALDDQRLRERLANVTTPEPARAGPPAPSHLGPTAASFCAEESGLDEYWLQSSRVVLPDGEAPAALLIREGRVAALQATAPPGGRVTNVEPRVISPGLVDCHVHLNEPGRAEWEGFESGTRAAAAGGVTTLVDMPLNCIPVTTTRAALEQKLAACRGQCFVDVGFWGGVVPSNLRDLPELARAGVLGCKAFLVHSGIDEFPNTTEAHLRAAMPVLRDHGLPLLAHAELDLGASVREPNPRAYRSFLESRPGAWEEAAIALLIQLCRETGCHVHIVHLSAASSLDMLRSAKAEGLPLTVETCPHYLCLDAEAVPDGATEYKCAPPIREHENREALWRGLFEGVIDFVITDHSPCTPVLKGREHGDFHDAWGGIASLQLGLPALWTEARRRGASIEMMSRWLSQAPARFAGLAGKKGQIAAGAAADLVIWDPDESFMVEAEALFFRHKLSPYLKREMYGRVHTTLLGGRVVYDGRGHPAGPIGNVILHRNGSV